LACLLWVGWVGENHKLVWIRCKTKRITRKTENNWDGRENKKTIEWIIRKRNAWIKGLINENHRTIRKQFKNGGGLWNRIKELWKGNRKINEREERYGYCFVRIKQTELESIRTM